MFGAFLGGRVLFLTMKRYGRTDAIIEAIENLGEGEVLRITHSKNKTIKRIRDMWADLHPDEPVSIIKSRAIVDDGQASWYARRNNAR